MTEYILKIDGMMCGHCEAHVNDMVRNKLNVKKVESSHTKGETVIVADELDEQAIRDAIAAAGYELKSISSRPYEKKGLFSRLKK